MRLGLWLLFLLLLRLVTKVGGLLEWSGDNQRCALSRRGRWSGRDFGSGSGSVG